MPEALMRIGWKDLLDILIVSFVIYRVILLVRGTRAAQMILGLLIISTAFLASELGGLLTLNWLLNKFLGSLFLLIIIIFQQDIRRALMHVGRHPFFRNLGGSLYPLSQVEEIAQGVFNLASKKVGALVVIERQAELNDFVSEGVPVDASISKELITSTFLPTSPLHDGAVIIQENRIAAAGCFLPLTQNPLVSKDLGTRHRAAIGISEETDAVAIVVSEERGTVSLVEGGRIIRYLDGSGLRDALWQLFEQKRSLKSWLFDKNGAFQKAS